MTAKRHIERLVFVIFFMCSFSCAYSGEISADEAVDEVLDWSARESRRDKHGKKGREKKHRRKPSGEARTYSVDGTNLFHLVSLEGGGYVAVSAESSGSPILGFSGSEDVPDVMEGSPLWVLLAGDTAKRRGMDPRRAAGKKPAMKHKKKSSSPKLLSASSNKLLAASGTYISSETSLDDVRVSPLVQSKWNQSTVDSKNVYNYYTPNNYVCGCVATAMAQLMRFHKFPSSEIAAQTFTCYTGTSQTATNLTMKGGTYDWSNMPLVPASTTITEEIQEAIGALCYDAGVAVRMRYNFVSGESGTLGGFECDPFRNVFGFASANGYIASASSSLSDGEIKRGIFANLDAGCPVQLGIDDGGNSGHSILADGYGYADDTLYCHLNMGWSGSYDYWYALPTVSAGRYTFVNVSSLCYNIFPSSTGEIVSGRVTDAYGDAVSGATVAATIIYSRETTTMPGGKKNPARSTPTYYTNTVTATTSSTGIFSFLAPTGTTSAVKLSAAYGNWASSNATASVTGSVAIAFVDYSTGEYSYDGSNLYIGNSWGNDMVVVPTNVVTATVSNFVASTSTDTDGSVYSLSFSGTAAAWYQVEYSEVLTNETWSVYTNILVNKEGQETIDIPIDSSKSNCFYRVRASSS